MLGVVGLMQGIVGLKYVGEVVVVDAGATEEVVGSVGVKAMVVSVRDGDAVFGM